MKVYPADLLEPRSGDREAVTLELNPRTAPLFARLHGDGPATLAWIIETVKGVRQSDDDLIFDQLYRRGHILSGTASLLKIAKLEHVLAVLDFALDVGRTEQSFERHSLVYVVNVLANAAARLLEDFQVSAGSGRDLGDLLEECRNYLLEPLRAWNARPASRSREWVPPRIVDAPVSVPEPVSGAVEAPNLPVPAGDLPDDSVEELQIPSDKAGLTSAFCEEVRENLAQVGHRLVELEQTAEPTAVVNHLFRLIHTVKGGARMLRIRKMESLSHRLESMLDAMRRGERRVDSRTIDLLLDGRKLLERMTDEVASRGPLRTLIRPWFEAMKAIESGAPAPATNPEAPARESKPKEAAPPREAADPHRPTGTESIRIPTEKLDDVLNTASEVFISRIRLASDVAAMTAAIRHFKQTVGRMDEFGVETILDRLAEANRKLVGELRQLLGPRDHRATPERIAGLVNRFHRELESDARHHSLSTPEEFNLNLLSIDEIRKRLQKNVEHLEQLSTRLQTGAMSFRMVPISQLFDRFPTQVREVARQLGKKIRLEVGGSETELDKVLINQLADPLLHILRNAIDHGIESPERRAQLGKPETGHVYLRAYYHGSHAVIEVRDDGKGIDADRVLAKAIEAKLVEADKALSLSRQEIFQFIFEPGLSTASSVSTLSGRGVGMDVVRSAISEMQGNIAVDSEPDRGTTIRMKLPLTLAVVGILLVRERTQRFALPIQHIDEILTVKFSEIHRVSENTIYNHRGTTLPVTTLSSVLEFPPSFFSESEVSLVILSEGEKKIGILVDAILGRQEVLIKSLGSLVKKAPFVMGCTILSDSRLVLILNAWEIVHARSIRSLPERPDEYSDLHALRKPHSILIVDDSAIQRHHLTSVLGEAGYSFEIAENGFEGLKRVRNRQHSAICVDVVMPLMDGFEFTERLRAMPAHARTPVLFITSQASQVVRERAVNLGVKDYFEKPVDGDRLLAALDEKCLPTSAKR
jgi:two-component system chemotaxis sensor kinase CheA